MNPPEKNAPFPLPEPEIRGDVAEAQGLVWSQFIGFSDEEDAAQARQHLLVPEQWVDDAVRGALAQYFDDIVDAVKAELKEKMRIPEVPLKKHEPQ